MQVCCPTVKKIYYILHCSHRREPFCCGNGFCHMNLISVPRLTEKDLAVQMLRDKSVIKGSYETVLTVNKSGPST